ncbi:hypothetical protein [Virgibacillus ihumii]|uniref:hypothetical protein n=1 Tax=Virgibacillus ihumii TaxID=2686091 RepID=UPI00157D507F|nr:hypothetical protein [Virgibacillus ihumii]
MDDVKQMLIFFLFYCSIFPGFGIRLIVGMLDIIPVRHTIREAANEAQEHSGPLEKEDEEKA